MRICWSCAALLLAAPVFAQDPAAIMAKAAANVEGAVEARKQFLYLETIRASLVGGNAVRKEDRPYYQMRGRLETVANLRRVG
jgi:hypothetical protein